MTKETAANVEVILSTMYNDLMNVVDQIHHDTTEPAMDLEVKIRRAASRVFAARAQAQMIRRGEFGVQANGQVGFSVQHGQIGLCSICESAMHSTGDCPNRSLSSQGLELVSRCNTAALQVPCPACGVQNVRGIAHLESCSLAAALPRTLESDRLEDR